MNSQLPQLGGLQQQCKQTTLKIAEALVDESRSVQRLEILTPPSSPPDDPPGKRSESDASALGRSQGRSSRDSFAIRGGGRGQSRGKARAQETLALLRTNTANRLSCFT